MELQEALDYFGNAYQLALKLKIKPQNITAWKKTGVIPLKQQYIIEAITNGYLKAYIDPRIGDDTLTLKSIFGKRTR